MIVHGYGEHCGRYEELGRRFVSGGYGVYAYDHRWHGRSSGEMGQVRSVDMMVDDMDVAFEAVARMTRDTPLFVFAHSMGALVTGLYSARYKPKVSGIMFSSGLLKVADDIAPLLQRVAGLAAALLPRMPVLQIDPGHISRDPREVSVYATDPYNYHGKITARTGHAFQKAIRALEPVMDTLTAPMFISHGTGDRLADPAGSRTLYERAGSRDKTLRPYEGAYHEVHHDHDREQFFADLTGWIAARC